MLPINPPNFSVFLVHTVRADGRIFVPEVAIEEAMKLALTMPDLAKDMLRAAAVNPPRVSLPLQAPLSSRATSSFFRYSSPHQMTTPSNGHESYSKKRKADSQEMTMDQISPPDSKRMKSDEVAMSPSQFALLCMSLQGRLKDLEFRELLQELRHMREVLRADLEKNSRANAYWKNLLKAVEPFIISLVQKFPANELHRMVIQTSDLGFDPQMFNKIFKAAVDKLGEMTSGECIKFLLVIAGGVEEKLENPDLFAEYVLANRRAASPGCLIRLLYTLVKNQYLNLAYHESFLNEIMWTIHCVFSETCFQAAYIFAKAGYRRADVFNKCLQQIRVNIGPGQSFKGSRTAQDFVKNYLETNFPNGEVTQEAISVLC